MTHKGDDEPVRLNLGLLLLRGFQWFDHELLAQMEAAGGPSITRAQSQVFAHLDNRGTRSSELARRIGVSRQAVHQTVGDLEGQGLVALVPDPTNARAKLVALTVDGQRSVALALATFATIEEQLAGRIGRRRVAALRDALEAEWSEPDL